MKITSITHTPVFMPNMDTGWRHALGGGKPMEGAVVKIEVDEEGLVGIGYAGAVLHYGVSHGALIDAITIFADALVGMDPRRLAACKAVLDRTLIRNHQAKCAIDIALHDLVGKIMQVPVHQLLGGLTREEVPAIRILSLKQPDEMAALAKGHIADGYRYLKIKADGDRDLDTARVAAIREAVGPDIHLTIDANQSYSVKGAIAFARAVSPYDIYVIEQPVHRDDIDGLAEVTRNTPVAIEADESADSAQRVFELASRRAVDSISIKIWKVGGLQNALSVARICEAAQLRCRMGAAVGSRIVNAAALHLAAAVPNLTYAAELAEFHRLENDPAKGLDVKDGVLRVPTSAGLGVELVDG